MKIQFINAKTGKTICYEIESIDLKVGQVIILSGQTWTVNSIPIPDFDDHVVKVYLWQNPVRDKV
jgi:hypothetical protein